jgi:hypothetical protein
MEGWCKKPQSLAALPSTCARNFLSRLAVGKQKVKTCEMLVWGTIPVRLTFLKAGQTC